VTGPAADTLVAATPVPDLDPDGPGGPEPAPVGGPGGPRTTLDRLGRWSWWVFGVQFLAVAVWSEVLYSRYAVTWDASTYLQASWLIAHGHLDPYSTTLGHFFWQDHFSLVNWVIAPLDLVWPHDLTVLWAQDAAAIGAGVVAFRWILRLLRRADGAAPSGRLVALGVLALGLLFVDPWTYWALSFDIHMEVFGTFCILAAVADFADGRERRAWMWVVLTLSCGDVSGSWIAGLGLSAAIAALAGRERRRRLATHAALLVGTGMAWAAVITAIGGNRGSGIATGYGYLVTDPGARPPTHLGIATLVRGALAHPSRVVHQLWGQRVNEWANLGPMGYVGVATAWTAGIPLVIFVENGLQLSPQFTQPLFQSLPVYPLAAVGLVTLLLWAHRRWPARRRLLAVAMALVAVNAVAWSSVWLPRIPGHWLRVSPAQAAVLTSVERSIPGGDEVVVSQGVAGRFADWVDLQTLAPTLASIPVSGSTVWFVVAPNAGIETVPVDVSMEMLTQLAGPLHATLVADRDGIWAFRWHRPAGVHQLQFPQHPLTIAGWTATSAAGVPVTIGPEQTWHVASNGREGYVVAQDYWARPRGIYQVGVSLSAGTPVNVEVSNAADGELLARRQVPVTAGIVEVSFPLDLRRPYPRQGGYAGWGPFRITPVPPAFLQDDVIEIRVWSPAHGQVSVYSVTLVPAASAADVPTS
jgi:hypothetical protein